MSSNANQKYTKHYYRQGELVCIGKNGILVATMVLFSQESGYGRIKVANSANLAIIQGCARGFARRGFSLVKAHFDKRSLFVQSLESSTWDAMCS